MNIARRLLDLVPIRKKPTAPPKVAVAPRTHAPFLDEDIPQSPPYLKGLPVVEVERLWSHEKNAALLREIRGLFPFHDREFDYLFWPIIQRLARLVHLLPASERHHHAGAGGLFRHSLEVGFFAGRSSGEIIFMPQGEPLVRRNAEVRWQVCCFIAGLLHDIGKPMAGLEVHNHDGTIKWFPFEMPLMDWCEKNKIDRYYLHWTPKRGMSHEDFTSDMLGHVVTVELQKWIISKTPEAYEQLRTVLNGKKLDGKPIYDVMHKADKSSITKNLQDNGIVTSQTGTFSTPIPRFIIEAMRRLMESGAWSINQANSYIFIVDDSVERHLFIRWKQAVPDIINDIRQFEIPGIPQHADSLAEIMLEAGLAERRISPKDGQAYPYWPVATAPLNQDGRMVRKHLMLKMTNWGSLFNEPPSDVVFGEIDPPDPPPVCSGCGMVHACAVDDKHNWICIGCGIVHEAKMNLKGKPKPQTKAPPPANKPKGGVAGSGITSRAGQSTPTLVTKPTPRQDSPQAAADTSSSGATHNVVGTWPDPTTSPTATPAGGAPSMSAADKAAPTGGHTPSNVNSAETDGTRPPRSAGSASSEQRPSPSQADQEEVWAVVGEGAGFGQRSGVVHSAPIVQRQPVASTAPSWAPPPAAEELDLDEPEQEAASRAGSSNPPGGVDPNMAREELGRYGEVGAVLLAVAEDIASGRRVYGEALTEMQGKVVITFPEGLKLYLDAGLPPGAAPRTPPAMVALIEAAGFLLLPDPNVPSDRVWNLSGVRGLAIRRDIGDLMMMIANSGGPAQPAPKTSHQPPPPPQREQKSGASTQRPRKPEGQRPEGREARHGQGERKGASDLREQDRRDKRAARSAEKFPLPGHNTSPSQSSNIAAKKLCAYIRTLKEPQNGIIDGGSIWEVPRDVIRISADKQNVPLDELLAALDEIMGVKIASHGAVLILKELKAPDAGPEQ